MKEKILSLEINIKGYIMVEGENMKDNTDSMSVANEYIDVIVNRKLVQLCKNCYHAFGWKTISSSSSITSIKLRLVRNKKIKNRLALCKLQRECEDVLMELERLEKSKNFKAGGAAFFADCISVVLISGSFITYLFDFLLLSIFFVVSGFLGLGLAYFIHNKLIWESESKIELEMNRYYDAIYQTCSIAEQLLN